MEKNFMRSDSIVELEFLTERETGIHYHENFELLYIMGRRISLSGDSPFPM